MAGLTHFDLIAALWFLALWGGFSLLVDHSRAGAMSLSRLMDEQRAIWMETMRRRDQRIVDASIMAGLQNGTAFFASSSLIAIGGCFALLNATDRVLQVFADLPFGLVVSRPAWEIKVLVLLLIYAYAFFKFGWAYRLFNYASILIGAVPAAMEADTERSRAASMRAAKVIALAGRHFNRGLRAFFFSIGLLGWLAGPLALFVASTLILAVLVRRQFFSQARQAVAPTPQPAHRR